MRRLRKYNTTARRHTRKFPQNETQTLQKKLQPPTKQNRNPAKPQTQPPNGKIIPEKPKNTNRCARRGSTGRPTCCFPRRSATGRRPIGALAPSRPHPHRTRLLRSRHEPYQGQNPEGARPVVSRAVGRAGGPCLCPRERAPSPAARSRLSRCHRLTIRPLPGGPGDCAPRGGRPADGGPAGAVRVSLALRFSLIGRSQSICVLCMCVRVEDDGIEVF